MDEKKRSDCYKQDGTNINVRILRLWKWYQDYISNPDLPTIDCQQAQLQTGLIYLHNENSKGDLLTLNCFKAMLRMNHSLRAVAFRNFYVTMEPNFKFK